MKRFKAIRGVVRGLVIGVLMLLLPILPVWQGMPVSAATTADVTVNATPAYVAITCNVSAYGFGTVNEGATYNTSSSYFGIDNTSTVTTNQTIGVTAANWTGGNGWGLSETATAGVVIAGLKANKAGTWGTGDVIVRLNTPNTLAQAQAADTDYAFGIELITPTSYNDGIIKLITVRITATAA